MSIDTGSLNCAHCGMIHQEACPRIRAIEYYPNGTMKRVEYHDRSLAVCSPAKPSTYIVENFGLSQCSGEANNCEQDEGA